MKNFFCACLIFISTSVMAQSEWQWAYEIDFENIDVMDDMCVDNAGNIYSLVNFRNDTLIIENDTLITYDVNNQTSFIVKLDKYGNYVWSRHINTHNFANCKSLCVDNAGNVYVGGTFGGDLIVKDQIFNSPELSSFFILKFDSDGDVLNAFIYNDSGAGGIKNMCINSENEICMFGDYYRSFTLGGFDLNLLEGNNGNQDIFVAKADTNGNILWAKSITGYHADYAKDIVCDKNKNIYLTGKFYSPQLSFGDTTLLNTVDNFSTSDVFIAKYSNDGELQWVEKLGNDGDEDSNGISVDNSDNIYVAGYFSVGSFVFADSLLAGGAPCTNSFIIKFDCNFERIWGKSFGNQGNNAAICISTNSDGKTFVAGTFVNYINNEEFSIIGAGALDIYIAELNYEGLLTNLYSIGGDGHDIPRVISIDLNGDLIINGFFRSQVLEFGDYSIYNSAIEFEDFFIAKKGQFTPVCFNNSFEMGSIFPNPAAQSFTVDTNTENCNLQIFDTNGKAVKEITNYNGEQITIIDLSKGLYFVKLIAGDMISVGKLVVE